MPRLFYIALLLVLLTSCSQGNKPTDKLKDAVVDGNLSKDGSDFEGVIRLRETTSSLTGEDELEDEVTIYTRKGCIRREVKTTDRKAPIIGMIYKSGDTVVTIYGISPVSNVKCHYQMSVLTFNEEKEARHSFVDPTGSFTYDYIRPYSNIFYPIRYEEMLLKDSIYHGSMGKLSLKANFYDLHSFQYCRAIWSPEITIDTALVRMTEIWMPATLPTLALYVNTFNAGVNATDDPLRKWTKKITSVVPDNYHGVVCNGVDAHPLTNDAFAPPAGSISVTDGQIFTERIGNYREGSKAKAGSGNGSHHHH